MALRTNIYNIADGLQSQLFWSKLANIQEVFTHIIIRGADADINISWWNGNNNVEADASTIKYTDKHGDDIPIQLDLGDGEHMVAIDTFYGAWGWVKIDPLTATTGTVEVITVAKDN